MFKRILAAGFLVGLSVAPALAADVGLPPAVVTKTLAQLPAASPCTVATAATPLSCSGWYFGVGLAGEGSNANIIGNGISGSVFAGGITPTIDAGYQYMNGNWIFGAELDLGYSAGTGAIVNGVGNSFNGLRITEDFQFGGNLNGLLGTQAQVTVPAQLAQSVLGLYAHIGTSQWQLPGGWANGIVSGAGFKYDISPRIFGDIRYSYTNFSAARAGGLIINDDNAVLATINFKIN